MCSDRAPYVVGLDPSLTATGVARADGVSTVLSSKQTGCARLADLRDQILDRLDLVDLVMIEGYAMGTGRQSHTYAIGELGGVIRLALWERDIPYLDVPPAVLKKWATGRGNASKDEMLAAAIRRLGYESHDHNVADALWLRDLGRAGMGGTTGLSKDRAEIIRKLDWPLEAVT